MSSLAQVQLNAAIVRNPLVVSPDTSVIAAIAQMSGLRTLCSAEREGDSRLNQGGVEARSSCVIVVEDNQLIGILTERDMVRLITQKRALENLLVCEVMTRSVTTLRESAFTDLFIAVNLLQQYRIRHLPIVDEHDCLVGLVTHESLQQISRPIDLLRLRLVAEVMTTEVVCAMPNVTMIEIARCMSDNRVSSVVIVQQQLGKQQESIQIPLGIVTERDVIQFKALGLNLDDCQADSVMSTPIFSVQPNDSLWLVHQLMEQRFIGRLTVIGSQGQLLGIITKSSLLQVLNPLELYKLTEVLEQKVLQLEAEKVGFLENRTIKLEQQVEERTVALKAQAEQGYLIASIASQIRSSLDLQVILNTTVEKLQSILGCDRVTIWQLQPDLRMMAAAEAASGQINVRLGQQVYDLSFSLDWLDAYQAGGVRVVSDIYTEDLTNSRRDLLKQPQTRAKVLLPIIQGNTLWGLLEATESYVSRQWQPEEISLLEQLATQLAIALQQATAYQQAQTELAERRQTEARLRESEQRFVRLAGAAPVGIFRKDAQGHCVYVNERWCSLAGLTEEEAFGTGWMKGVHPGDQDRITDEWYRAAQENRPFRLEYRFQRSDGAVSWVFGQAEAECDTDGGLTGYIGTVTDITDLKQAQELIIHNSLHDPLTNLPNRILLMQRLEFAVSHSKHTEDYRYAVLFLDLDRFKVINDSLGHLTGDQILITIGQRLRTHVKAIDLVARFGGDEFVILLEDIREIKEIILIVERILADCQMALMVNGYEMFTSLSIGVVVGTEDYHQAADLIRDADIAMYGAKAQGRNSYKIFNSEMHTRALYRLTLETNLRKALEQQEFIVYYQPIMDILKNQLVGFEALVRWQHPEHGFISPADFVPVAEEIGLILLLDRWVFQTACQQLARWKTQFADCLPLKISINLSAQDLRAPNLIDNIDQTLAATGLEGSSICLEVTESILIEDINQTIELLTQLRARNIQISIDDFGTGYSSLNYLHRLPADNLKIDRSFVSQMQMENRNYQVVNTIITLSNQLGLMVVAEGIETQEQLQLLQQLGCQFGQGYLFSKPLASHEIETRFLGINCQE